MQKAQLTGGQSVAAVLAGFFGNLLFSTGFTLLGFVLFGSGILAITGASILGLIESAISFEGAGQFFDAAGGILGGLTIGLSVASGVLILLGFLLSGWILSGGKVRKPWAVTVSALLISAALTLPLFILYVGIAFRRDSSMSYLLVAFLGTAIVGILLWLWMTWARRGPAVSPPEIAAAPATSEITPAPVTPAVPPPTSAPAAEGATKPPKKAT